MLKQVRFSSFLQSVSATTTATCRRHGGSNVSWRIASSAAHLTESRRSFGHHHHDTLKYHNIEFKLHDLNGLNFYVHDHHNTCDTIHHHGQNGLKVRSEHAHVTKETGEWFHTKIQHGGALGLRVLDDMKSPSKLLLAFSGDLELTVGNDLYTIKNLVCGQGHDNGNNWWIGGSGKAFQRRHIYDTSGNYPALHYQSIDGSHVIFTQCKTGVENCFAITILK